MNLIIVGLGGALGAVVRYLLGFIKVKGNIPVMTMVINIIGSFLIGLIVALALKYDKNDSGLILFLKVGVCGGFTTFSTFSLESMNLLQSGHHLEAFIYMFLSFGLSLCAVFIGTSIVR
ncbi:MAG: fluoride efflux transporter CrcB [Thomasclavelia sp.]|jgi:CrcB protein|nr:fluoride efflux transporter CrcB [Thomasclavelia sp.]